MPLRLTIKLRGPQPETGCGADLAVYCFCRRPDDGRPMAGCEACGGWFHVACIFDRGELAGSMSAPQNQEELDLALSALPGGEYVCGACRGGNGTATVHQQQQQQQKQELHVAEQSGTGSAAAADWAPKHLEQSLNGSSVQSEQYCVCRLGDTGETMVSCDRCDEWFHVSCLGLPANEAEAEAAFSCPVCEPNVRTSSNASPTSKRRRPAVRSLQPPGDTEEYDLESLRDDLAADGVSTTARMSLKDLITTHRSRFSFAGIARRVEAAFLSAHTLEEDGFATPILIPSPTAAHAMASSTGREAAGSESILGAKFPSAVDGFDVDSVLRLVGAARQLDVVQVATQGEARGPGGKKWNLGQWREYFADSARGTMRQRYGLLNLLSLEVSDSRLMSFLESPLVVREIDWIANLWPQDPSVSFGIAGAARTGSSQQPRLAHAQPSGQQADSTFAFRTAHTQLVHDSLINHPVLSSTVAGQRVRASLGTPPKVRYYCLMGVKGCYTDWHIDFGGTSVWYHVVSGIKIFLLLPPTPANLKAYETWSNSPTQQRDWLGATPGLDTPVYIEVVSAGDTILLPSGWIHAVYTPCDSLVFGGNFLHSLAMGMQMKVYEIENATAVAAKFRFPHFEATQWLVVAAYIRRLKEDSPRRRRPLNRWEADNLVQLTRTMKRLVAQFEPFLPRGLRAAVLGDAPGSGKEQSDALEMLDELERLVSLADDSEVRSAKHRSVLEEEEEDMERASEGDAETRSHQVKPYWQLSAERNEAQGFIFSFEKLDAAVHVAELANRCAADAQRRKRAKQEEAAARRQIEQQAQLSLKLTRHGENGELRATSALQQDATMKAERTEHAYSAAAASYGSGAALDSPASDSSSDSEASDQHRASKSPLKKRRATSGHSHPPVKKPRVAPASKPVVAAKPPGVKAKSGNVHERLAKKLKIPLRRR